MQPVPFSGLHITVSPQGELKSVSAFDKTHLRHFMDPYPVGLDQVAITGRGPGMIILPPDKVDAEKVRQVSASLRTAKLHVAQPKVMDLTETALAGLKPPGTMRYAVTVKRHGLVPDKDVWELRLDVNPSSANGPGEPSTAAGLKVREAGA